MLRSTVPRYADPYCKVKVGDWQLKTKVIPKTLTPEWNETMVSFTSGVS